MTGAKVDILLAVYNGSLYLPEQLNSIFKQSYADFRVLIRDNHSDDQTPTLLQNWQKSFPNKIDLKLAKENVGVIGNFSQLISLSKAPYVMFSDHDDVWLPNKIEDTLAAMHSLEVKYGSHTPLLVHSDLIVVNKDLKILDPSFWSYSHIFPEKGAPLNSLLLQNVVTGCTMMANRALLELAQPIPQQDILMHDWWLALVAAAFGHIEAISHPLMLYRQHGKNTLGATRFNLAQKIAQSFHKNNSHSILTQAKAFFLQYKSRLSPQQQRTLEAFLQFEHSSFFKRAYSMSKHGLCKQGFLRNTGLLLTGKL